MGVLEGEPEEAVAHGECEVGDALVRLVVQRPVPTCRLAQLTKAKVIALSKAVAALV